jgi:hypothetical protein
MWLCVRLSGKNAVSIKATVPSGAKRFAVSLLPGEAAEADDVFVYVNPRKFYKSGSVCFNVKQ